MRPVHVVTSFLLRRDGQRERVLILRRSGKVGSYPGRWAGVSGYLEGPAERQALTEVQEETGLGPSDIVLVNTGAPLRAPDPSQGTTWVVHPFLFLVVWPERIRLDWEHTEYRWVRARELQRFHTVPSLAEALERVYPPPVWGRAPEKLLEIARNRDEGASVLAVSAALALATALRRSLTDDRDALVRGFTILARAFGRLRPSMAPLPNLAASLAEEVASLDEGDAAQLKARLWGKALTLINDSYGAQQRIAEHARPLLSGTVLTTSYSTTVLRALRHAQGRITKAIVGEGRPGFEGRKMVKLLTDGGLAGVVVTDALAPAMAREADAVVAGADTVTAAGDVVNKAGTYALALAARDGGKPFYVLTESLKVSPDRTPPELEVMPPQELWPDAPKYLTIENRYFDVTPARLVTAYVTEEGVVDRRWIAARAGEHRRARRRLGM